MKTLAKVVLLIAILSIELSPNLYSQCFSEQSLPVLKHYPLIGNPNFIQLYNNGYCISGEISDTTLWFDFYPEGKNGLIYWGYSSPLGYGVTVTSISVYDTSCTLLSVGNEIANLSDEMYYVSFGIRTSYIDNFCPYFIEINPLAVEFGPVVAQQINEYLHILWTTYSERNSNNFIIQYSYDLNNWVDAASVKAQGNKSTATTYSSELTPVYPGIVYIRIIEYDYNGGRTYSEIIMSKYYSNQVVTPHYDLAGRLLYIR